MPTTIFFFFVYLYFYLKNQNGQFCSKILLDDEDHLIQHNGNVFTFSLNKICFSWTWKEKDINLVSGLRFPDDPMKQD